jgi:hypothetical protein
MPVFTGMTKPRQDIKRKLSGFESPNQHETRNPRLETNSLRNLRSRRFGSEQNAHQLIERRVGSLVHFFQLDRADRMLHDEHRMIRRAEGFLLRLRQRIEGMRDQRDRESSALLNLD